VKFLSQLSGQASENYVISDHDKTPSDKENAKVFDVFSILQIDVNDAFEMWHPSI